MIPRIRDVYFVDFPYIIDINHSTKNKINRI